MHDETTIRWEAIEHQPLDKSADWFWALGIIAAAAAATAVILGDTLFGILIIAAAFTMAILAKREQKTVVFALTRRGLSIDGVHYPPDHLHAFWISEPAEDADEAPLLLVDTPRFMTPDLVIPLVGVDPRDVHAWFVAHEIPEKPLTESLALAVLEFFGF
ncbi:MAG TPA: hypothetical protein VFL98_03675 [Candidatus Paceibacterota bacterium]|nr:hypothetical protein [Candidatus Paceibacterota bacterium]